LFKTRDILEKVPAVKFEAEARQQLERVLESPGFARNERLSRFLRFLVDRHLEGRDEELKESVIGTDVFGRRPDYNPKQDAIVRTEAGRLRARITEYYAGEGKADTLIIELPKGGYVPVLRCAGTAAERPKASIMWRWPVAGLGLAVVSVLGAWWITQRDVPIAIAVLPLENVNHDPADDYLADGLTDELIRDLSIIEGLAPRSRTSSFVFRSKPRNLREVGKELAADYVLEGSVMRSGPQLRVNVQLVRARDDFPVWSGRYDRELTDVFSIQDDISRGIVNSLRLKLNRGRRRYEISAEAYDFYLRARTQTDIDTAPAVSSLDLYQKAIKKDPSFAPAYAGLASAYALRSEVTFDGEPADDGLIQEMRFAAQKAIQLDPLLPEAHDALGAAYAHDAHWQESENSFRQAIDLDHNDSRAHVDFATDLLLPLGRIDEAVQQVRLAERSDPLSGEIQGDFAAVLLSAGRYPEAARHCERASGLDRIDCLGRVRLAEGKTDQAIEILRAARLPRWLAYAYGRAGRRQEAESIAAVEKGHLLQRVLAYAGLGDKDRTFEALDRMTVLGPVRVGRTLTFPELAFLRGDPRLKSLRKKVGLPE
jgi:TolB-like protein/tetratricopeptide (TPR) repeat protein